MKVYKNRPFRRRFTAALLVNLPYHVQKAAQSGGNSDGFVLPGTHETIRTSDLPLRRRLLYPAELHGHMWDALTVRQLLRPLRGH